ncbi:unnamed protein product [Clavelina lepadiformis]|uniref:Protein KRI1 homolog n=1 Tax=Clavelina lepadiformis TaxID=159417 RepID=A0ABP0F8J6_CLALP
MDKLTINKDFAKKYDKYRKAEEFQRLKDKYGNVNQVDSSSGESEDDKAEAINSKLEKDFFRTLVQIKNKDPILYKKDEKFFHESSSENDLEDCDSNEDNNEQKKKPLHLKDMERKVVLERGGLYEEDNEDKVPVIPGSYYAELDSIKKSLTNAVDENDISDDQGAFLTKKEKVKDNNDDSEMKLSDLDGYWQNPDLDENEKFLRDYILNRRYLDVEEKSSLTDSDREGDSDTEDEMFVKKQENFEHKYNFRFQEPDSKFIQSYPRTVGDSVRQTSLKTKQKRVDRKQRKDEEKRRKVEELKRLKQLKREEIMDKVNRLRAATGNNDINFTDHDIENEFNPEHHEKRMKELFDEDFYAIEEEEKPYFSDIGEDDFGEDTNWDNFEDYGEYNQGYIENLADCEQPDFVMDCDHQSNQFKPEKKKLSKAEKKKRKSYEAKSVRKSSVDDKPIEQHMEEYHAMNFEDVLGDMPCRFKYRSVPANDYGLSTADILLADNRTLNSWCSLKRVVQHRSDQDESFLRQTYARKSRVKKKKYFEKFYEDLEKNPKNQEESNEDEAKLKINRKLNSRQRRRKRERERRLKMLVSDRSNNTPALELKSSEYSKTRKRKSQPVKNDTYHKLAQLDPSRLEAYGLKPKKVLKKAKYGLSNGNQT